MGIESLPPAGRFVDDNLVGLYQDSISQLIADLGRPVILYLPASTSGCPNCYMGPDFSSQGIYDNANPFGLNGPLNKPFPTGAPCPVCFGTHQIKTANSTQYKALIQRNPKDLKYSAIGKEIISDNVYLTKMQIVAFEDIKIAEKALIDGEVCVPIRSPIKTGLRDLAYVRQFWERVDG